MSDLPKICTCCGGHDFAFQRVLCPKLIAQWQLAPDEVDYVDRQQGLTCTACSANLRSQALALAIMRSFAFEGTFLAFIAGPGQQLRVLEINEAGQLSPYLKQIPGHILATYPAVDMHHLPYPAGSFDLVVHSDTLEHVCDPLAALAECRRVLRPRGFCAFTVPIIVGRLSASRADKESSFHGPVDHDRTDFAVQTEFGADAWGLVIAAGFAECRVVSLEYPAAQALVGVAPLNESAPAAPADASAELPWTGERLVPSVQGAIAFEHLHRYALARELTRGKVVLDIASGEGYGSNLLAQTAAKVYGVDIAADAVANARRKYARANLEFLQGDAAAIPLPDASVDVVVSFETIEHVPDHDRMLAEIRRVLRPDGSLLLSSPNRPEYTEKAHFANPYHVKELDENQLRTLLSRHFSHLSILGQRVLHGSAIMPMNAEPSACIRGYAGGFADAGPRDLWSQPLYHVVLASNGPVPALQPSLFDGSEEFAAEQQQVQASRAALTGQVIELQKHAANLDELTSTTHGRVAELEKHASNLQTRLDDRVHHAQNLEAELAARQRHIDEVTAYARKLEEEVRTYGVNTADLLTRLEQSQARENQASQIAHDAQTHARELTMALAGFGQPHYGGPPARFLTPAELAAGAKPRVSIIIPTKNGGPLFEQVLQGLRAQVFAEPVELLILDSGSTDSTIQLAQKYGARVETIAPATFNHGLTRNHGIELTAGEIVILLTQDAVPADSYLLAGLAQAYDDPAVGGAYSRQVPRPTHDVLVRRNITGHFTGGTQREVRHIPNPAALAAMTPFESFKLCIFDNVCSSVRRAAWEKVPFRANEFGEDLDWSKRSLEAGWAIAYEPAAAVIHSHERPVSYEYKRTYMCHRKLYELFELCTIPSRRYVLRCILAATLKDASYVLKNEPRLSRRLTLLAKIPALAVASVLGQYRGARDEKLGRGRKHEGV